MSLSKIIWLATYPKSGTTWVRSMLTAVRRLDSSSSLNINALKIPSAANRSLVDECLGIKTTDLTRSEMRAMLPLAYRFWLGKQNESCILKTHDAYCGAPSETESIFPQDVSDGVIHIVRDPRDVAISARHYFGVSQDEAIQQLNDPERWILNTRQYLQLPTFLSDWSTHTASWLDSPLRRLTLRYEDLLQAPSVCLEQMVEFCGWEISPEQLAAAVQACEFSQLKKQEQTQGYNAHFMERQSPFFRAGRAGQWQDQLDVAQIERIVDTHGKVMQRMGYSC